MSAMAGGCLCGKVRYVAEVAGDEAYLCHCRMCQRASGNVSLALVGVDKANVRWLSEPAYHASSPIARRGFCATCGASLSFEYHDGEGMDLTVASFDEPGRFRPAGHFAIESRLDAFSDTSHLPGKSSERNGALVARWTKAVGHFPG